MGSKKFKITAIVGGLLLVAVGSTAYSMIVEKVRESNCIVQFEKYRRFIVLADQRDSAQFESIALEMAKLNRACNVGIIDETVPLPEELVNLSHDPRITKKADDIWKREHGLFELPVRVP